MGQNSKYPSLQKMSNFLTSGQSTPNGLENNLAVVYSKIQNRSSVMYLFSLLSSITSYALKVIA